MRVEKVELQTPKVLQHLVAMQAHFVGFIEVAKLRACGIEPTIQVEQVGVVVVGDSKSMNHQLGQRGRFVRLLQNMLPAGKGLGAALGCLESVVVDLVRVQAFYAVPFQNFTGGLMGAVMQAGARLDQASGQFFQSGLVGRIGQCRGSTHVHGVAHPSK